MKMPDAWLAEDVQAMLADPHVHKFAPFVLHGCILAFTAGNLPKNLMVRARLEKGATQWRAVWLNAGIVGYAHVSANVEGWGSYYEADHGTVTPEETIAWARPLNTMTQASLTDARCTSRLVDRERHWSWQVGTRLQFANGQTVDLPLFGSAESEAEEEQLVEFLDALTSTVAGNRLPESAT